MCRTCLRNLRFLSFLQYHSDPVIVVWTSTGSLQTGSDDSSFGNVLIKFWGYFIYFTVVFPRFKSKNAATQFSCDAPEMICRLWNFTWRSISLEGADDEMMFFLSR